MERQHEWWNQVEQRLDGRPWSWLAERAGWTYPQLQSYRQREPKLSVVQTVAKALGCAVKELVR